MESKRETSSPETFQWDSLEATAENTDEEEEAVLPARERLILSFDIGSEKETVDKQKTFRSWDWKRHSGSHKTNETWENISSNNDVLQSQSGGDKKKIVSDHSTVSREEEKKKDNLQYPLGRTSAASHEKCQSKNTVNKTGLRKYEYNALSANVETRKYEIKKITSPSSKKDFSQVLFLGDDHLRCIEDAIKDKGSHGIQVFIESRLALDSLESAIRKQSGIDFQKRTLLVCSIGMFDFLCKEDTENESDFFNPSLESMVQQAKQAFPIGSLIRKAKRIRKKLQQLFTKMSEVYFMYVLPVNMMPMLYKTDDLNIGEKDVDILNQKCYDRVRAFNNYVKLSVPPILREKMNDYLPLTVDKAIEFANKNMIGGVKLTENACRELWLTVRQNIGNYSFFKGRYDNVVIVGDTHLDSIMRAWPGDRFNCTVLIDSYYKLCHLKAGDPLMKELSNYKDSVIVVNLGINDLYHYRIFTCPKCKTKNEILVPNSFSSNKCDIFGQICVAMENAEIEIKKLLNDDCTVIFATAHMSNIVDHQRFVIQHHSEVCEGKFSWWLFNPSAELVKSMIDDVKCIVEKWNKLAIQYSEINKLPYWDKLPCIYGVNFKHEKELPLCFPSNSFIDGINPTHTVAQRIARYFYTTADYILQKKPQDLMVVEPTTIKTLLGALMQKDVEVLNKGKEKEPEVIVKLTEKEPEVTEKEPKVTDKSTEGEPKVTDKGTGKEPEVTDKRTEKEPEVTYKGTEKEPEVTDKITEKELGVTNKITEKEPKVTDKRTEKEPEVTGKGTVKEIEIVDRENKNAKLPQLPVIRNDENRNHKCLKKKKKEKHRRNWSPINIPPVGSSSLHQQDNGNPGGYPNPGGNPLPFGNTPPGGIPPQDAYVPPQDAYVPPQEAYVPPQVNRFSGFQYYPDAPFQPDPFPQAFYPPFGPSQGGNPPHFPHPHFEGPFDYSAPPVMSQAPMYGENTSGPHMQEACNWQANSQFAPVSANQNVGQSYVSPSFPSTFQHQDIPTSVPGATKPSEDTQYSSRSQPSKRSLSPVGRRIGSPTSHWYRQSRTSLSSQMKDG